MRSYLLFLSVLLLSFSKPNSKSDFIQWNDTRKLTWNDFKATPPENGGNAALTSSGILMGFTTNGESYHFDLSCNFDQGKSWGRVKNDYILAHEQGHFDIAEWYTRKLYKALKAYRYKPESFTKDVNLIYRNIMSELQQTQDQYDGQTDHSRNIIEQKNWLNKIHNSLDDFKDFADYKSM